MAATRLIALHVNKSKGAFASMHERIEYSQNPEKTEDGEADYGICVSAGDGCRRIPDCKLEFAKAIWGAEKLLSIQFLKNLFYPIKMRFSKSGVCGLL
ncbi:hypothetical protein [Lactimicrobium massiliense]|uniref:hypothetical protein n=1 Tax=Lactimicrobium massiliense TaxID=2161814 RepID=UPI0014356414|nr:hypothetical protein [Lactimicrobium massiliense]